MNNRAYSTPFPIIYIAMCMAISAYTSRQIVLQFSLMDIFVYPLWFVITVTTVVVGIEGTDHVVNWWNTRKKTGETK